jgi:cytoskeletal protein CcmA (bactofilin family)
MFRTGHRNDPAPAAEPTAEPAKVEPKMPELKAVETPAAPAVERSAARPMPMPMDRPGTEAVLGKGVTFDGTLRFTGTLRIEGTFKGQILAGDSLLIGEGADVAADITCGTIKVSGEARGSLTATRSVELKSPARVSADVNTPSLIVAEGVQLEGNVRMNGAPRAARHDRPKRPAIGPETSA